MNENILLRKDLRKILLVQWSRFGAVPIRVKGSCLFVGVNGSGKSTILDALTYFYTGNTQFNIAAKDKDRTIIGYVRGDTKSKGKDQYLRSGNVISYIVAEFYDPTERRNITAGVCFESPDIQQCDPTWFIHLDSKIDDFNFYIKEGSKLTVTPKNELRAKGVKLKSDEFYNKKEKGLAALRRTLGIRCTADELRRKIVKMMSFKLENNIDEFIRESVLPEEKITTIDNLKEQKKRFDDIKETYEGIKKRKKLLEEIEKRTVSFEKTQKDLDLKTGILYYQNSIISQNKYRADIDKITQLNKKIEQLKAQETELEKKRKAAEEAKSEADHNFRNNDLAAAVNDLKSTVSAQIDKIEDCEGNIKNINEQKDLICSVKDICNYDADTFKIIKGFDSVDYTVEEKSQAFENVRKNISESISNCNRSVWEHENDIKAIEEKIGELSNSITELEKNNKDFPKNVLIAKDIINKGLKERGIGSEARILAELIEDIRIPEWREALEVYLGRKKFDLIVEAEYVKDAMEIYHEHKIQFPNLVLTDKLENHEADENSAATILSVPNKNAKKYINYLLGRIFLCNSLEELHEHPLGGIMADGALAKSYTMRNLDLKKADYYLGRDATKLRLEKLKKERVNKLDTQKDLTLKKKRYEEQLNQLNKADMKGVLLDFTAVENLPSLKKSLAENKARLTELESDPRLTELKEILDKAVREYDQTVDALGKNKEEQGKVKGKITAIERERETHKNRAEQLEKEYNDFILMHLELKKAVTDEYQKASANKPDGIVLQSSTIDRIETERNRLRRVMEDAQIDYNTFAGKDTLQRGESYIPIFRREMDQLVNIDAENVKNKLEEQQKVLEKAFIYDYIAELCEKVNKAKTQIDAINRELKTLPFGQDIYEFKAKERSDKASFFRMKKKIYDKTLGRVNENFIDNMDNDPEFIQDMTEFMDIILNETNESEYADYRFYYMYDMKITNQIGSASIEVELSEKQGSASNGEKQTPYYIILAASLMQCYPRNVSCARLAFIDEAFAALTLDRIEPMVKYLQQNGFQVIYAAPPEKIKGIGTNIDSTVSLIETGRYTNVVEGLTDEFINNAVKTN